MSTEKHTQGRLAAYGTVVLFSDNAGGFDISACPSPEANARRLVACWNALLPFTTEQVEAGVDLAELVSQRDELLAALEELLYNSNPPYSGEAAMDADFERRYRTASKRALAAIANVKGGAA